jgi:Triose-phosphate Transporter family
MLRTTHTTTHSLNVAYNYSNKKALNMIKAPLTLSALQMLVGVAYVLPLWLFKLRAAPSMSRDNLQTLLPIGSCHATSHLAAVIGLGAGSVSFTHIVKVSRCLFYSSCAAIAPSCAHHLIVQMCCIDAKWSQATSSIIARSAPQRCCNYYSYITA